MWKQLPWSHAPMKDQPWAMDGSQTICLCLIEVELSSLHSQSRSWSMGLQQIASSQWGSRELHSLGDRGRQESLRRVCVNLAVQSPAAPRWRLQWEWGLQTKPKEVSSAANYSDLDQNFLKTELCFNILTIEIFLKQKVETVGGTEIVQTAGSQKEKIWLET